MGKIAILGLGPSLELFLTSKETYDTTIGVNDIYRYFHTEVVVCLDPLKRFSEDRLQYIRDCEPKYFYSHLKSYQFKPSFVPITLSEKFPREVLNLDEEAIPKSYCSPFVAAVIGFKFFMGSEIHLYGVDLINHPKLSRVACNLIAKDFLILQNELKNRGSFIKVFGNGILKDL